MVNLYTTIWAVCGWQSLYSRASFSEAQASCGGYHAGCVFWDLSAAECVEISGMVYGMVVAINVCIIYSKSGIYCMAPWLVSCKFTPISDKMALSQPAKEVFSHWLRQYLM